MRRLGIILLLLTFCLALPLGAQETQDSPPAYPGVAEVVPQLARLTEEKVRAATRIAALRALSVQASQLESASRRQEEIEKRIAEMGDLVSWNTERLQEMRRLLADQRETLKRLLDDLSGRLVVLDQLRREWRGKKEYWQRWEEEFGPSPVGLPQEAFRRAQELAGEILAQLAEAFSPVLALQEGITTLHEANLALLHQLDTALAALRADIFSRTAIPLTNREFFRQFDHSLWQSTLQGAAAAQEIRGDFLRENVWLIVTQILVALGLGGFIRRQRQRLEITREWQFILDHPWATGIFAAVVSLSFLYASPPALWRLLLWTLAAVSAAVLLSSLLQNPRKILMVNLLAGVFILSLGLQIIALPQPFYRLYLVLLAITGSPLLFFLAARNRRANDGRRDGFTSSLQAGAAVLLMSLIAQLGGFSALASRLINATVETVFVVLFVAMIIRLGRGGIEFLLTRGFFQKRHFFREFGRELTARLQWVFQAVVVGWAAFYLPVVWEIFDSTADVWHQFLGIGFQWGEAWFSVQMLALVLLVLYLAIVVSWMIRALLESEIFPLREFDRGVRDAIKKLLHYFLIVIGLLLALSLAGIELKNFTVLAGAFGIGLGFGLQNIVNNFVSGLILLFERPIKVGDVIVLDNVWGTVRKIGLRSTIVETLDDAEIIVPNSDLISEKVTNWTLSTRVARIVVTIGVAYGSDVAKVIGILQEAAREHPEVLAEPPPSTLFSEFGDSSLNFELRVWISDVRKRLRVKSELNQFIDRRFREEGVEIPFPQRDLHLRSVEGKVLAGWRKTRTQGVVKEKIEGGTPENGPEAVE